MKLTELEFVDADCGSNDAGEFARTDESVSMHVEMFTRCSSVGAKA